MKQVVQAIFDNPSLTQVQIGKMLGISDRRVSQIMKCDRVLAAYPVLARSRVKAMVPDAVKRYGELLKQKDNPEVARKVTERILDTNKVLDAQPQVQVNVFATMPLENVVARVNTVLKTPAAPIFDAEIISTDEEKPNPLA